MRHITVQAATRTTKMLRPRHGTHSRTRGTLNVPWTLSAGRHASAWTVAAAPNSPEGIIRVTETGRIRNSRTCGSSRT